MGCNKRWLAALIYLLTTPALAGSLVCDAQGDLFFTFPEPGKHARVWTYDGKGQARLAFEPLQLQGGLSLTTDPEGTLYVMETRDFQAWGEFEVVVWKGKHKRTLVWPKWRKRGDLKHLLVDGQGIIYWVQGNALMRRETAGKISIDSVNRGGPVRLSKVQGMAWGANGQLTILDNGSLFRRKTGGGLGMIRTTQIPHGLGLSVEVEGSWLVADQSSGRIMRLAEQGQPQTVYSSPADWKLSGFCSGDQLFVLETGPGGARVVSVGKDGQSKPLCKVTPGS